MVAERKERAVGFLKLVVARKIDEAYRTYTAPGGRHHNVYFAAGFAALRQGMKEAHEKFPHTRIDVKHVVGEGDLVAVHSHVTMEPGSPGVAVVHLFRFDEDDRIVELWDCGQSIPQDSPNVDGPF